jgi:chromosome segregation ATPase
MTSETEADYLRQQITNAYADLVDAKAKIERLRALLSAKITDFEDWERIWTNKDEERDAEIERLRADVELWKSRVDKAETIEDELRAEIDHLSAEVNDQALLKGTEEYLSQATRNVAAGLELNWGANWDAKMRAEVIGHLVKVSKLLLHTNDGGRIKDGSGR